MSNVICYKKIETFHPNGNPKEVYFEDSNGLTQGEYYGWYKNGQPNEHASYVNGKRHGEYNYWHENGQPREHAFYVDGKRHGEYKWWYENGQPWEHSYWVDGELHGEYNRWRENGQLWEHAFYVNGVEVDISSLVEDQNNITEEEHIMLTLKFSHFPLVPKQKELEHD